MSPIRKRPSGRRGRRRARSGFLLRLVLLALLACGAWIGYEAWTWPDVGALARKNPKTTAFIERWREGRRAAGQDATVRLSWTRWEALSPHLVRAVVVAEDARFYSHHGFDTEEIGNAIQSAIDDKEMPRGASTITQQLAKNLWLSPSRNPMRKVREAFLTRQLEQRLSKRRILEIYLNVVELGPGIYGAEAASRRYFDKSARELTEDEAAQLAASLPNPKRWHPGCSSRSYARHVARVRTRMGS